MMMRVASRESGLGTLPEHRLVASCFCLQFLLLLLWDVTHYFVGYVEAGRRSWIDFPVRVGGWGVP